MSERKSSLLAGMLGALALVASAASAAPAIKAPSSAAAARDLAAFIDRIRSEPYAPPGFVVLVIRGGDTVFERAYGMRNLATRAPMTLDTPIYGGSVTKAYTGLLAAILEREGVLPVSASLADVWPGLSLPRGLDPNRITAAALLSHSSGLDAGGLQVRTRTGQFAMADVPIHLSRWAEPEGSPGFVYSNLGPFLYSAMVEARTGRSWREAMNHKVLVPLGLRHTVLRVEDYPKDGLARCHVRAGGRWRSIGLKPTPVLIAAGGHYASGRDTAAFLKVFLTDGSSAGGRIPASVLRRTWERFSVQDKSLWGLHRDGYGLGWDLGVYDGHRFVARSGGWNGCRSHAFLFPEEDLGVVVFSVGDAAVNTFNTAILEQAVDLWTQSPVAGRRAEDRVANYRAISANEAAMIDATDAARSRRWPVDAAVARAVVGFYENLRLGRFEVVERRGRLEVVFGVWGGDLVPTGADTFHFVERGAAGTETVRLIRDASGAVVALQWDDDRFERLVGQ